MVYLDFQKTFDNMHKLRVQGIQNILESNKFRVSHGKQIGRINSFFSDWRGRTIGKSQGSVG